MKTRYNENDYIILFDYCRVVTGKERCIICDFQKEKIKFIPNQMTIIIEQLQKNTIANTRAIYSQDIETFNSYIDFLLDEKFAFTYTSTTSFKNIENVWQSPEIINNATIAYDFKSYPIIPILNQLDNLLTKFIEFRFSNFNNENIIQLTDILNNSSGNVIRSIKIIIPYGTIAINQKIIDISKQFPKVECVTFFNSPNNKSEVEDHKPISYVKKTYDDITKANINSKFLINNIQYFFEAQLYNPYYNKKIAIDINGDIKNCIKNQGVFGNVNNDEIKTIVTTKQFQELWNVSHDKIIGIKDSELRYNTIISNDLVKTQNGFYEIVQ